MPTTHFPITKAQQEALFPIPPWHLRSGVGLKRQRRDADIAKTVMLRMMKRDILVLPVHDSFITYHEMRNDLETEMRRVYIER